MYPKIFQIRIHKIQNVDLDWFSKEPGHFLSREEDHFLMHTKQDKVFIMNYYPKFVIHMSFMRATLAYVHKREVIYPDFYCTESTFSVRY